MPNVLTAAPNSLALPEISPFGIVAVQPAVAVRPGRPLRLPRLLNGKPVIWIRLYLTGRRAGKSHPATI